MRHAEVSIAKLIMQPANSGFECERGRRASFPPLASFQRTSVVTMPRYRSPLDFGRSCREALAPVHNLVSLFGQWQMISVDLQDFRVEGLVLYPPPKASQQPRPVGGLSAAPIRCLSVWALEISRSVLNSGDGPSHTELVTGSAMRGEPVTQRKSAAFCTSTRRSRSMSHR